MIFLVLFLNKLILIIIAVCKKMQYATLNLIELGTLLEDLMKPIATLKALREYYIINNDAKSYNNFMYLVKDTVRISGKKDMWSKFINSKCFLNVNKLFIILCRFRIFMTLKILKDACKYEYIVSKYDILKLYY